MPDKFVICQKLELDVDTILTNTEERVAYNHISAVHSSVL